MSQGGKKVKDFLYEKESYLIRGACFAVWKEFGGAFKEVVIERSLVVALKNKELEVQTQKRIDIYFQEVKVGTYIPDIIVNNKIIIEIKSKSFITKQDKEQFWKYLKGSNYKLGFLINFSPTGLNINRVVYDTVRYKQASAPQSA